MVQNQNSHQLRCIKYVVAALVCNTFNRVTFLLGYIQELVGIGMTLKQLN